MGLFNLNIPKNRKRLHHIVIRVMLAVNMNILPFELKGKNPVANPKTKDTEGNILRGMSATCINELQL